MADDLALSDDESTVVDRFETQKDDDEDEMQQDDDEDGMQLEDGTQLQDDTTGRYFASRDGEIYSSQTDFVNYLDEQDRFGSSSNDETMDQSTLTETEEYKIAKYKDVLSFWNPNPNKDKEEREKLIKEFDVYLTERGFTTDDAKENEKERIKAIIIQRDPEFIDLTV